MARTVLVERQCVPDAPHRHLGVRAVARAEAGARRGLNRHAREPGGPEGSTLLYCLSYDPPYKPPHNKRR